MKFFYNLERFEGGEYVVVMLEEDGKIGTGAIIPERKEGENYKTIMGVIEEYRHVVELAKPQQFASLSFNLRGVLPKHPKVTFAISAAALELFSKLENMRIEEILSCNGLKRPIRLGIWEGEVLVAEKVGGVFEVLSLASQDLALSIRRYPRGEMEEVLLNLSRYFAGYVLEKW